MGVEGFHLTQGKNKWQTPVSGVMSFWVPHVMNILTS
jgi:hypothetical protein